MVENEMFFPYEAGFLSVIIMANPDQNCKVIKDPDPKKNYGSEHIQILHTITNFANSS